MFEPKLPSDPEEPRETPEMGSKDFGRFRSHAREEQASDFLRESLYQRTHTIHINRVDVGGGFFNQHAHAQQEETPTAAHGGKVYADRIPDFEANLIFQVYQPPPSYEQARGQLDNGRFILLQGARGVGKRASAIRLMLDILGTQSTIYDLSPDSNLMHALPTANALHANTGYIVDDLPLEQAKRLTGDLWRTLANRVREAHSYLAICLPDSIKLPSDLPVGYLCTLELPAADSAKLVREHLYHYAEFSESLVSEEQINACLAEPAVEKLLQTKQLRPKRAAQLASKLWGYLIHHDTLEAALIKFRLHDDQIVRDWFENFGLEKTQMTPRIAVEERALRITLAIFHGLEYHSFRQLRDVLTKQLLLRYDILANEEARRAKEDVPPPVRLPFEEGRSALQRAQARLRMITVPTSFNEHSQMRVVELNNPYFRGALLKYLWQNDSYAKLFDLLLDWLRHLGGHNNYIYRIFAADAVTHIAQLDFRLVMQRVLIPWIDARHRNQRSALSRLFGNLVGKDNKASNIMALLAHWSKAKQPNYVWTAIRAYSRAGLRHPQEAMEQWHFILDRLWLRIEIPITDHLFLLVDDREANEPMVQSLFDSMHSLFTQALLQRPLRMAHIYGGILSVLCHWLKHPRNNHSHGLVIYIFLTLTGLQRPPVEPDAVTPPALLESVNPDVTESEYVQHFATLLNYFLSKMRLRKVGLEIIEDWIQFVNAHPDYYVSLRTVLQAFTELDNAHERTVHDRTVRIVCIHLRRLANRPRNPIEAARTMMGDLGLHCERKQHPLLTTSLPTI